VSQWPPWLSMCHSLIRHQKHHDGCRMWSMNFISGFYSYIFLQNLTVCNLPKHCYIITGNAYPSGAPDFTSDSCCPVICVSLFHVIVLSFDCSFCLTAWYLYIFYSFTPTLTNQPDRETWKNTRSCLEFFFQLPTLAENYVQCISKYERFIRNDNILLN